MHFKFIFKYIFMCVCVIENAVLSLKPTPSFRPKKSGTSVLEIKLSLVQIYLHLVDFSFFLNKHIWGNQPEKDRKGGGGEALFIKFIIFQRI